MLVHFVIMGCGRVGAALGHTLEANGHTVAIVDQNPESFRRLSDDFDGRRVTGLGFDRETLIEAGIGEAYGFAAVSNGDNSNILAARVVRETFGVHNVVARIYDPHRAEIYQRLGIATVATVRWSADQVLRRLLPQGAMSEFRDASGHIVLAEAEIHPDWVGRKLTALEEAAGCRVAFVTRLGVGILPTADMVYQDGDVLHVLHRADDVADVERVLALAPKEK